jgi:hypothetical protein
MYAASHSDLCAFDIDQSLAGVLGSRYKHSS